MCNNHKTCRLYVLCIRRFVYYFFLFPFPFHTFFWLNWITFIRQCLLIEARKWRVSAFTQFYELLGCYANIRVVQLNRSNFSLPIELISVLMLFFFVSKVFICCLVSVIIVDLICFRQSLFGEAHTWHILLTHSQLHSDTFRTSALNTFYINLYKQNPSIIIIISSKYTIYIIQYTYSTSIAC